MLLDFFIIPALIIFIYMSGLFLLGLYKKNNGLADVGWGFGFILLVLYTYFFKSVWSPVQSLVTLLVLIWGFRLSYHILKRNWGKEEDFRYKKWREEWGKWVHIRAFFQVFMLQGFFMLIIASSFIVINSSGESQTFGLWGYMGLAVWIIGFLFESMGDLQLKRFINNPENKGKICDVGLWKYTRHPNYFGEATMWWGIWILALSSPYSLLAIVSPITITILVRFVSGVPMLEKKFVGTAGWDEYKRKTNTFIPWFSKKI